MKKKSNKTIRRTIRLTPEDWEIYKKIMEKEHRTFQNLTEISLKTYIEKQNVLKIHS